MGTEDAPIVFTSGNDEPLAGDWQCIRLGPGSSASELEYVTLQYGGQPCEATGADYETALDLASAVRRVVNVTITDSATHGVLFQHDANVRTFEDVRFARNEQPSILVHASEILSLGEPLTFEDDDDYIEVDTTFSLGMSGDWHAQDVPFRIVGAFGVHISNTVFREIEGTAIRTSAECESNWCDNEFDAVEEGPLSCDLDTLTSCP